MSKTQMHQEALARAVAGQTMANYPAIFEGFAEKGIPVADIRPRENVFTFNAWKALGRYVRKGEHGVKVVTWVPVKERDEHGNEVITGSRARTAVVFHISQTEAAN